MSQTKMLRFLGVFGTLFCVLLFITEPSFPTPDKILIFLTFVFMMFGQAGEMLKRFLPFVVLLLAYESFRGAADGLNSRVEYLFMPNADRFIFGALPTQMLQSVLWHGQVMWYDYVFYVPYMLHFVLPIMLGILIWKKREKMYWRYITAFITVSFAGFLTFLAFPAAPPWMASEQGMIEPIVRVSSSVWATLGIHDFPSFYNNISPNPVAAVPSLHAAYATLVALSAVAFFKSKWRYVALLQPILIYIGTVYQGEHYAIDEILGAAYGFAAFYTAPAVLRSVQRIGNSILDFLLQTYVRIKPSDAVDEL